MAPLHQPSSTHGGSNLSLPSLVLRSLRSQWQAQVQAIPRAVASARGAIGLVQQLQRPVLEATPVTQKMGSNSSNSSKQLLMTFKSTLKRSSPKGPKPPCNSQELDSAGCTTNPPHRRETSSNAARNTCRELGKRWSVAHDLPLPFTAPQYWDVWISKAKGFKSNKRRSS